MDAGQIRELKPELLGYLAEFNDCFDRCDTRAHFPKLCRGAALGFASQERGADRDQGGRASMNAARVPQPALLEQRASMTYSGERTTFMATHPQDRRFGSLG